MSDATHDDRHDPAEPLTAAEIRVLGCLVEKEATVPATYPLTLNSLRTACNQATSRDPVVDYDDHTVETALAGLRRRGLTRTVHSTSNRGAKYRHVLPDAWSLDAAEIALMAVLMLRGAQTVGELKQRSERIHRFETTDDVAATLGSLQQRSMATSLPRQPGQKDVRWVHLLAGPPTAGDEPTSGDASGAGNVTESVVVDGVTVRAIATADREGVVELWRRADLVRPWNDPFGDIDRSIVRGGVVLVAEIDGDLVGAVMVGDDGHRGWLNYLASSPDARGRGVGRALVTVAESWLVARDCPKVNVQIRSEHAAAADFYESMGFSLDDVLSMGKRL